MVVGEPRFNRDDMVGFTYDGYDLTGTVEIVDWRGDERDHFKGCDWSYDVYVENSPHFEGSPCLYKHVPECDVRSLQNSL